MLPQKIPNGNFRGKYICRNSRSSFWWSKSCCRVLRVKNAVCYLPRYILCFFRRLNTSTRSEWGHLTQQRRFGVPSYQNRIFAPSNTLPWIILADLGNFRNKKAIIITKITEIVQIWSFRGSCALAGWERVPWNFANIFVFWLFGPYMYILASLNPKP